MILLFPVDCNYVFKHVGWKMMRKAEKAGVIAQEQYGSRKGHKAINLAVNKVLTYNIMRQLKKPGAFCSNDAKCCYDLIGPPQASMIMQHNGFPKAAVDCLFMTLQEVTHEVCTGFGDSKSFYGSPCWIIPLHGIGQGNGAGPAIWAVVSTHYNFCNSLVTLSWTKQTSLLLYLLRPNTRMSFLHYNPQWIPGNLVSNVPVGPSSLRKLTDI
jgi:hypothetical protein